MRRCLASLLTAAFCFTSASCSDWTASKVRGTLLGGGATFPAPLYEKWIASYRAAHPDSRILYQAVGSGAGIQLFAESKVDFGASDAISDAQIGAIAGGVEVFPMTAGSVVLCYNIPGVSNALKLSREVYAGIFLGSITSWNDPKISADNKGITLPDLKITTVHRSGASGTTFVFTKHLSSINEAWKKGPGAGLTVQWPAGIRAMGNDGIAEIIQQTPGAIGYLGYSSAIKHKLAPASLQNKTGEFIPPSIESAQAALASVDLADNLHIGIADPEGKTSYPIVTFSWILTHKRYTDPGAAAMLKSFLKYGLTDGQKESSQLGFIPLPPNIAEKALQQVERIWS